MRRARALSSAITLIALVAAQSAHADAISTTAIAAYQVKEQNALFDSYSTSPRGDQLGWGESYILMGLVSMYDATGDTSRLVRAMSHADAVLANRADRIGVTDDIRHRVVPAWPTGHYTGGVNYAWEVHAGMVSAPIARMAYVIRKNAHTPLGQYMPAADRYVRDLTDMAVGFEEDWRRGPNPGEGYYRDYRTGGILPYNQANALGRTYVQLYLATGESRFRERAAALATFFKSRLRLVGSRYDWAYSTTSSGSEDLSHAAINADFAFECYRAGIVFDATDMGRFVNTFMAMSNGTGGFYGTVSGKGGTLYGTPGLAGMWGQLGFIDPTVRTEFYKYYRNNTTVGSVTWGSTIAAYLADTAKPFAFNTPAAQPSRKKIATSMEPGAGYFAPAAPGPRMTGLATATAWAYDTSLAHHLTNSVKISIVDDPATAGPWLMDVPAGRDPGGNALVLDRAGYVGLWLRTASPGLTASLLLQDLDGPEESSAVALVADGQWHLYQWSLDDPASWYVAGGSANGALDGLAVTLTSLLLRGNSASATAYADDLMVNVTGPLPEPSVALPIVTVLALSIRRRRGTTAA